MVQQGINELNAHSTVNLADLHDGADRLFDTLFIYENWPKISSDGWRSRLAMRLGADHEKLDYPMSVIVSEDAGSIEVRLVYAAELFDEQTVEDMLEMLRHLLGQVLADIRRPWREVPLPTGASHARADVMLNPPAPESQPAGTFLRRFEEQVRRGPERTAVVCRGESLTYRRLDEGADRLAALLAADEGRAPEDLVVVCMEKDTGSTS